MQETAAKSVSGSERQSQKSPLIVECPDCHSKLRFTPKENGMYSLPCPKCKINIRTCVKDNEIISVQKIGAANNEATLPVMPLEGNRSNGMLILLRYGGFLGNLGNKSFALHLGQNTVGRYDDNLHSDIEIKGDPRMSRRSICIEVFQKETGFFFKMKVLRATWPVMHNDKPLVEGEVIYLNYGDNIKLGKTTFIFNKASSK